MDLVEKIFNAGVVGAGGGGFPSHIKARSKVEFLLANGAECEPLIHKDYELMVHFPEKIIEGIEHLAKHVEAKKTFIGIKEKNKKAINSFTDSIKNPSINLSLLGDFYPAGDEYELVYAVTKRLIPPHGLPLDVGCLVNNVETLYNISNAVEDIPVAFKFLSVTGAVRNPKSFFVPLGTSFRELIELAGGTTLDEYGIFVSGILMGKLTFDVDEPVTKTTAGIIILPKNHYLINRMERPIHDMNRIGKSACDQCSYCTEFCPRYLLGYDVQPHKVMRSLAFTTTGESVWNQYADLCCSCGLCSLYACPEDLYPREACNQGKDYLRKNGIRYNQTKEVKVHPMKEGRRVPLKMLMKKLQLTDYDRPTPFEEIKFSPERVKLLLKQHAGQPARPVVKLNQKVSKGELVADIEPDKVGAKIHASIDGVIKEITDNFIIIEKGI